MIISAVLHADKHSYFCVTTVPEQEMKPTIFLPMPVRYFNIFFLIVDAQCIHFCKSLITYFSMLYLKKIEPKSEF